MTIILRVNTVSHFMLSKIPTLLTLHTGKKVTSTENIYLTNR